MSPTLDVRVWIAWGGVLMASALMIRNPILLTEILAIALTVRVVCVPPQRRQGWGWFVRVAAIMAVIGVVFNALTVHAGDRVLVTLPSAWPVIGGDLTGNAIVYGLVSSLAFFTLVVIGTTLSPMLRWTELTRVLPRRVMPLAVAGSVAWAFLPQLGTAAREIRETQIARGQTAHGPRELVSLVVPLLGGGLDRAMTTAEALEARGFGVALEGGGAPSQPWRRVSLLAGLFLLLIAAYGIAVGEATPWGIGALPAIVLLALGVRGGEVTARQTTRYRSHRRTWRDGVVLVASVIAFGMVVVRWFMGADAFRFDPYPSIVAPGVDLIAMLALALTVAPVLVVPDIPEERLR